jgi:hypothetical protein
VLVNRDEIYKRSLARDLRHDRGGREARPAVGHCAAAIGAQRATSATTSSVSAVRPPSICGA